MRMQIDYERFRSLHARALDDTTDLVALVTDADLTRPTPCTDWDVRALLGHMIGQNIGFAIAVDTGDAAAETYDAPAFTADSVAGAWRQSSARLRAAFADADSGENGRRVRLVEVNPADPLPVGVVLAMQLLDTAVHAWDLAGGLGRSYRPADDIVDAVAEIAQMVPVGEQRDTRATFAPPVRSPDDDRWHTALAHLGRNPD